MNRGELFDLYLKEREYQEKIFGDYQFDQKLNVASFLQFIDETVKKAKTSYVEKWDAELPEWLEVCAESNHGSSPVNTYSYLIKIFALSGAALEAYTEIDISKWREQMEVNPKWRKDDGR